MMQWQRLTPRAFAEALAALSGGWRRSQVRRSSPWRNPQEGKPEPEQDGRRTSPLVRLRRPF